MLDQGGYARYDFSTATKLLGIMGDLKERYGSLENLLESTDPKDLKKKLEEFGGVGDVTSHIFLRELKGVWDISLEMPNEIKEIAEKLDIDINININEERFGRIETALVKLNLRYCKRKKCHKCPMRDFCKRDHLLP